MRRLLTPILSLITIFYGCLSTPVNTGQDQGASVNTRQDQGDLERTFEVGQFSIPKSAELLESTEFKSNGVAYMIEQRYRLSSGQIMYAYYDAEGSNSVTIQKIEEAPLLALGTDVNIPGMPGYREFNFGEDRKKLVQFMKLFKLGWKKDYRGEIRKPSLSDYIFSSRSSSIMKSEFILLLDLLDETWVLEHRIMNGERIFSTDTTEFFHVDKYSDL